MTLIIERSAIAANAAKFEELIGLEQFHHWPHILHNRILYVSY